MPSSRKPNTKVDKSNKEEVKMYIVPSFIVKKSHMEGAVSVLDDVELLEMSLTTQPSGRHLTPAKKEEVKNKAKGGGGDTSK